MCAGESDTKLRCLKTVREVRPILLTVCRSFIFWVNKMRRIGGGGELCGVPGAGDQNADSTRLKKKRGEKRK